jgi:hypothetical protein
VPLSSGAPPPPPPPQVESIRTSKYCLAPYGHGWGVRLAQYIAYGCVPVIIQQHVYQPLEDVLPYEDFALRLPRWGRGGLRLLGG